MKKQSMWKKALIACVCVVSSYGLVAHEIRATIQWEDQPFTVKSLKELSEDDMPLFFTGQWVLEWNEGDVLPLFVDNISGDFFEQMVHQDDIDTLIKPTFRVQGIGHFYTRYVNDAFVFSEDLEHWLSFGEFFTGTLSASMVAFDGRKQPEAHLTLTVNRRQAIEQQP